MSPSPGTPVPPVRNVRPVRLGDGQSRITVGVAVATWAACWFAGNLLGSAVLATRTALELLGNPENVRLSRGPIVEGAIIAAVQASTGSSLDEVLEAAEGAASLPKG